MDKHIKQYFREGSDDLPTGGFHRVVSLTDAADVSWEDLHSKVPNLCRGWVELSRLSQEDRVEFTKEFWLAKLPYHPKVLEDVETFFSNVDDIAVLLLQQKKTRPFEPVLIYSLGEGRGFFQGSAPATEEAVDALKQWFPDHALPVDYLAFLQIHDGFAKATDTGVIASKQMRASYLQFQRYIQEEGPLLVGKGREINPGELVPFYESFGMPVYQCFWAEWYPLQEMGNVYYSGLTHSMSDIKTTHSSTENMAFPTFLDWLFFYIEIIG